MLKSKGLIVTWGSVVRVVKGQIWGVHVATGVVVEYGWSLLELGLWAVSGESLSKL